MKRKIMSVGWGQELIYSILDKIEAFPGAEFEFTHLVEVNDKIKKRQHQFPTNFRPIEVRKDLDFTAGDREFLEKIEAEGVPTIRAMIAGDPYLRHLPFDSSLAYAAHIGKSIFDCIKELEIDIILASNDRLISSIALAICNLTETKFIALAYTVIPDNRTWFIDKLTPNSLIPIKGNSEYKICEVEAEKIIQNFLNREAKVKIYVTKK